MRWRIRAWLGASLVGVVLGAAVLAPARSDGNLLPNGGFELGTQKWAAPVGATLAVNASVPPIEGASAALLTSTTAGVPSALAAAEGLAPSWLALIALAGGLLLGAGAVRAASVARGRDIEA